MPPALRHLWGLGKEGGHGGKVERKAQCVFSEAATVKTKSGRSSKSFSVPWQLRLRGKTTKPMEIATFRYHEKAVRKEQTVV